MGVQFQEPPLIPGQLLNVGFACGILPGTGAPKTKGAGVARIVQRIQRDGARQFQPGDLSRIGLAAFGELQTLLARRTNRAPRRTRAPKSREEHPEALLQLLVWIQDDFFIVIVNQSHR
jgi:hypothetical protein